MEEEEHWGLRDKNPGVSDILTAKTREDFWEKKKKEKRAQKYYIQDQVTWGLKTIPLNSELAACVSDLDKRHSRG